VTRADAFKGDDHELANGLAVLVAASTLEDTKNRDGTGNCTRPRVERRIKNPRWGRPMITLAMVQIKRTGAGDGRCPRTL
jgi:hypothetical protein